MEIVQTGNNSDCPPFSKCWCDKHPNGATHPHCKEALSIGSVYLDIVVVLAIGLFLFRRFLKKNK